MAVQRLITKQNICGMTFRENIDKSEKKTQSVDKDWWLKSTKLIFDVTVLLKTSS